MNGGWDAVVRADRGSTAAGGDTTRLHKTALPDVVVEAGAGKTTYRSGETAITLDRAFLASYAPGGPRTFAGAISHTSIAGLAPGMMAAIELTPTTATTEDIHA